MLCFWQIPSSNLRVSRYMSYNHEFCETATSNPNNNMMVMVHLEAALFNSSNVASCVEKERRALLKMKEAFVDDYGLLSSWGSYPYCCHWRRILCDPQTGHVQELYLHGDYYERNKQPLRGEINPSLMELQYLKYLNLSGNDFNGSEIPKFCGSLIELRYLDLSNSSFGGKVPIELGKVSHLRVLSLSSNTLVGSIPSYLTNLSSLQELRLSSNHLVGNISCPLGNLTSLEILWIDGNYDLEIDGIEWLSNLQSLTSLDLSDVSDFNYYNNMLPIIGKLQNLRELWLMNCSLTEWFWRLVQGVDYLGIENSNLKGTIPYVPLEFTRSVIRLASNQIEGFLPPPIEECIFRHFRESNFKVCFPCEKRTSAYVENLEVLNLSGNNLSGELPECLDHFKSLKILNLSNNQLSGMIPNSMGSLTQLEHLVLRNNCFSGRLLSLQNATNLTMLDLGENELLGPIPPSWTRDNLKELQILSLRMNKLDGNLPSHLCYFTKLRVLDLSSNRLTGPIPSCVDNLVAMAQKHVTDDLIRFIVFYHVAKFVVIASFDWYLHMVWKGTKRVYIDRYGLVNIDLSSNQLVGGMPTGIGKLVELRFLNLSANKLSGKIISEIGRLKSL